MRRITLSLIALVLAAASPASAGTLSLPRVSTGDTITASTLNDPRAATEAVVNSLENVNISATAAIDESKILHKSGGHDHSGGAEGTNVTGVALEGYITGLWIDNNSGDASHDIDIATGRANDSTDSTNIAVSATLTAAIDTQGANGMDDADDVASDAEADTWYDMLVIQTSDGATQAGYYNKKGTSMNCPSGYAGCTFRVIGYVRTDSSKNILAFGRVRNYFSFDDPIQDESDGSIVDNTAETATLTVPPSTLAHVRLYIVNNGGNNAIAGLVRPVGGAGTTSNYDEATVIEPYSIANVGVSGEALVPADGSSQIEYMGRASSGTLTIEINTLGFWDDIHVH
ncbi:hypothetical protein LCGC14_0485670 [marine sediment metagenome]|uniref:Uncharacterized protein n=1 Tax=marine sediment metagenome TaxID=412755 RepID=A0A0F9S7X3_9ZZZZ